MKPEPLKDKGYDCLCKIKDRVYSIEDILSAVEWLKERNNKQRRVLMDCKRLFKGVNKIIELLDVFDKDIDKAFEDAIRK